MEHTRNKFAPTSDTEIHTYIHTHTPTVLLVIVCNGTAYWHFIDGNALDEYFKYKTEEKQVFYVALLKQYYHNMKQ